MFYIQDVKFSKSLTVHEAILTAAKSTNGNNRIGAGVFAFVTKGGTSLVFEDIILKDFLLNGLFTLIVGIDDITNTNSLKKLKDLKNMYGENLEIKVFYHKDSGSLFHPKFIWFKDDEKIKLITGSGNLTEKGLRRNREAFTINELKNEEINEFQEYWQSWIKENNNNLRELDDEDVISKAAINALKFTRTSKIESDLDEGSEQMTASNIEEDSNNEEYTDQIDYEAWTIKDNLEVLISEIPKNGDRLKQANFSMNVFENFFGGIAGGNQEIRILLRHIDLTGKMEEIESSKAISVKSSNYRFELRAADGLYYPKGHERPIGIFIKVATRSFIYSLFMPGDVIYDEVLDYLDNSEKRKGNKMRRLITDTDNLRVNCPNLKFWSI